MHRGETAETAATSGEARAIRVVTETRNLRTQPFVIPDEANSVGKAWEEWLEGIERIFRYFRITKAIDKKDAIIISAGKIARLEKKSTGSRGGRCVLEVAY